MSICKSGMTYVCLSCTHFENLGNFSTNLDYCLKYHKEVLDILWVLYICRQNDSNLYFDIPKGHKFSTKLIFLNVIRHGSLRESWRILGMNLRD